MKIVGITEKDHDCSISLFENSNLIANFKEERFSREKHDTNLNIAYEEIQKCYNFEIDDPEIILTCPSSYFYIFRNYLEDFQFTDNKIANIVENKNKLFHSFDHQYCHACSAYFTSGFYEDKTLVISFDGIGMDRPFKTISKENYKEPYIWDDETKNVAVYTAYKNKLKRIYTLQAGTRNFNTMDLIGTCGSFICGTWHDLTTRLGFRGNSEEGKVLGLATKGSYNEEMYKHLKKLFSSYENLNFDFGKHSFYNDFVLYKLFEIYKINENENLREDLAYCFQLLTEEYFLKFLTDIQKKYPDHTKLCLAGGLFANVKLNQKINELTSFEEIWIYPAMGDEGLSDGSCQAYLLENGYEIENKRIDNMFYGIGYDQKYIDSYITEQFVCEKYTPEKVSRLLLSGHIVGTFHGRSEVGPRALGNRSILADPRKRETHEYLNNKLQRNDIMPFAPIIMSEYIDEVCHAYKSVRTSEFMTMCYTVKDHWLDKIPAAFAPEDKSCRPQTVFKERNLFLYEILEEFNKLTGVPALVNTSFNAHGDPIINHPQHAIDYLKKDIVDYLILGDKLVYKKPPQ